MTLRIGLQANIIILFLLLFSVVLILLNNFYKTKQRETMRIFEVLHSDITDQINPLTDENIKASINQAIARNRVLSIESQVYSSVLLMALFIISCLIFIIVINILIKPLRSLKKASNKLKNGSFNVYVTPAGINEIRDLITSFNEMSLEIENTHQKLLTSEKQAIWKGLAQILMHEIKNPLTPILLTVQRLEEKFYNDVNKMEEIFPESLKIIYQEINNLQYLVTSFSAFAKDLVPNKIILDPTTEILNIVKPYLDKYDIVIDAPPTCQQRRRGTPASSRVRREGISFDKSHFYQIITNILNNAIEACEKNPIIHISLETTEGYMSLKIRDNGCGIALENIPKIFEPYYTDKSSGTGLGLAIVKKLCEANGCVINIESILNQGTTVELIMEVKD